MAKTDDILSKYDAQHLFNISKYQRAVDNLFNRYVEECARLGIETGLEPDASKPFSFENAPADIRKRYNALIGRMRRDVQTVISDGIRDEWTLSSTKNDALIDHLCSHTNVPEDVVERMHVRNAAGLDAFQIRKQGGLGLSDRVWNVTEQANQEMEMAIDLSLASGKPAAELSRDVRHLLKNPDMMYRRFREKNEDGEWVKFWRRKVVDDQGIVHWVKEPLENTGRGVYRSSYKNAMRMARTETNMAYRKADSEYWSQSDIILGIKIILSNRHPVVDICDTFNEKVFPKDFDFPGWHPQCLCKAVPVLPTEEEMDDYLTRMANGEDMSGYKFNGLVEDMPKEWDKWVDDNETRLIAMQLKGRLPYFVRNNIAEGFRFGQGFSFKTGSRWSGNMFLTDEATGAIEVIDSTQAAQLEILKKDLSRYSDAMQANFAELEKAFGQKRGLSMSFEDANKGKENPNYYLSQKKYVEVTIGNKKYYVKNSEYKQKWGGYAVNCQTCTVTHELRRRGFNVEAISNYRRRVWHIYEKNGVGSKREGYRVGKWLKDDGTPARPYSLAQWGRANKRRMTSADIDDYINDMMRNDGRYEIGVDWKKGGAHVFLAEKKDGVITFFDPQSGKTDVWDRGKKKGYKYLCKPTSIEVIRIDNKLFNPKLAETLIPLGELPIYADQSVLRSQRIDAARQGRLAKRTAEQFDRADAFWKQKKAEGDKRRRREQILANAQARHEARTADYIAEVMDARNAEIARYASMQTYVEDIRKRYQGEKWFAGDTSALDDRGKWKYKYHLDKAEARAKEIEAHLDMIDKMKPTYEAMSGYKSTFASYQTMLDNAKQKIIDGIYSDAQDIFDSLTGFGAAEKRFVDIKAYADAHPHKAGKPLTKIEQNVVDAAKALNEGRVADAEKYLDAAEKTREANEKANAAAKARREAAKKAKEEAEKEKKNKKTMLDATSADDVREIFGDDAPKFLDYYENAAFREDFTNIKYIENRDEIERKIKEFFDGVDFGHWEHSDLFGSIMDNGIGNIHQCCTKGRSYELSRYGYENYILTGKYNSMSSKRSREAGWKKSDYYRCGIPLPKDKQLAWDEIGKSSYGDTHVRFRKDKVVTTWTKENSLGEECMMSLTCDPKVTSLDNCSFSEKYGSILEFQGSWRNYVEIQYHTPKGQKLSFEQMESVVFPQHPESIRFKKMDRLWTEAEDSTDWYRHFTIGDNDYTKKVLDTMTAKGVDIYYVDTNGKVKLYRKGKPLITEAEAKKKIGEMDDVKEWLADTKKYSTKSYNIADVDAMIKNGRYVDAYEEIEKIRDIEKRATKLKDLIPDVDDWHKKFNIEELETAHKAISDKITWMETSFPDRADGDKVIGKWLKEMEYARDPSLNPRSRVKTPYPTWEIAYKAYNRKRNEAIYKFRKASIDTNIQRLQAFKTTDKDFIMKLKKMEGRAAIGEWADVEKLIEELKEDMLDLQAGNIERVLNIGECSRVKFGSDEFTQAKRDAAVWFKNPDVAEGFKAADNYMTKYAQELWKGLTEEEKHVLWLYTDGSQYINQEMLGTYCLRMKSAVDGSIRNGLADANTLTSVIEKAPALKEGMWMQSGKTKDAIQAIFGVRLDGIADMSTFVGKEGKSNIFMSCHSSANGAFTTGTHTGVPNDVVLSIYMPKGTKGAYVEPFASYGDNIRWKDGFNWTGTKRKTAPSNQVEFLLQRGAKFRITKAYKSNGKWHIDVDLIEQSSCEALDTSIPMFDYRRTRDVKNPKNR